MTMRSDTTALLACAIGALLIAPAAAAKAPAQRGQAICSLGGFEQRTLLLNSAEQWPAEASATGAVQLFGREVHWAREQVLLHALPEQPSLGISVGALRVVLPSAQARSQGPQLVLQVRRPAANTVSAAALSRPCVWVLVSRSPAPHWRVQVSDPATKRPQTWLAVRVPA